MPLGLSLGYKISNTSSGTIGISDRGIWPAGMPVVTQPELAQNWFRFANGSLDDERMDAAEREVYEVFGTPKAGCSVGFSAEGFKDKLPRSTSPPRPGLLGSELIWDATG